jgi:hypothetical protein
MIGHLEHIELLLNVLISQGYTQHDQLERLIQLLEKPKTFPQATGAKVTSP